MGTTVRSYVSPRPRRTGASVETRFPVAVHQFTAQTADILEHQERDPSIDARRALLRAGLYWGLHLLGATGAVYSMVDRGDKPGGPDGQVGALTPREIQAMSRWLSSLEAEPRDIRRVPTVWHLRTLVATSFRLEFGAVGYFVFRGARRLRPGHLALLETYMRLFEQSARTFERADFARDQQRLLGRKTVVAQLRPNDLLYQALRRLQKYVDWGRSAFILTPAADGDSRSVRWQIAAERLSGVKKTSARVGASFEIDREHCNALLQPRVVADLGELDSSDPVEAFLRETTESVEGLPRDLAAPRSILVVSLGGTYAETGLPLISVLTDGAKGRFDADDIETTIRFFADIGPLLARSSSLSHDLVRLWTVHESSAMKRYADDPDRTEALPEEMLSETAPILLTVDSLQVIQFRRSAAARFAAGAVTPLSFSAVERTSGTGKGERPKLELRRGLNRTKQITKGATALWEPLTTGREVAVKNARGLAAYRFAELFSRGDGTAGYQSALVVPIRAEGETAGLLVAYRLKPSEFIDIDKILLRTIAARLGERIEFRRHLADHARLAICVARIATAPTEAGARTALVTGAKALLNADHAFLMSEGEPELSGAKRIAAVAHTWKRDTMKVPRLAISQAPEGITGHVFVTGESIAADDVTASDFFRPLIDARGEPVHISSELAVAVAVPLSKNSSESSVFGVLDVFWNLPHQITPHERESLEMLGRHAGAVLHLARSLRSAEQERRSMERLLDDAKPLELATQEQDVLRWLEKHTLHRFNADVGVVWSQRLRGGELEVRAAYGDKERVAEIRLSTMNPVPAQGWIGTVFEQFRAGEQSLAAETFDHPSPARKQIDGTRVELWQANLAYCIRPYRRVADRNDRETAWAIAVYRFSPHNFDQRDKIRLPLVARNAEAALQRIALLRDEQRNFELTNVSEALHHILFDRGEETGDIIGRILEKVGRELNAASVAIVRYHEPGETPTRDIWPVSLRKERREPAREDGLSEAIRRHRKVIVIDLASPQPFVSNALASSSFLRDHPTLTSIVAVPLLDTASDPSSFFGVLYVNFDRAGGHSTAEIRFIERIGRLLAQCSRSGPTLSRMRDGIMQGLQELNDPSQLYRKVLMTALDQIEKEIRERHDGQGNCRVVGNLYMVSRDTDFGNRLRQRASEGAASGVFPGVQQISEGIIGAVAQTGKPMIVKDTVEDPTYVPYFKGMRAELAVPVLFREAGRETAVGIAQDVIGVLNLESSLRDVFEARHVRLLQDFLLMPVSSLLHMAESHTLVLQNQQTQLDEMVSEAAILVMHDMAKPIRNIGIAVQSARTAVVGKDRRGVMRQLAHIEDEAARFDETARRTFPYLSSEVVKSLAPMPVIERVSEWASQQEPPVEVRLPVGRSDFIIDRGQPYLVGGVLSNLHSNSSKAIRVRGAKGRIWIECVIRVDPQAGEFLDVLFNDNGEGIEAPPSEWPRLFHILREKKDRQSSGWGIGLPVSRRLMQFMGGDLDIVASSRHGGDRTTFRMQFKGSE